MTTTEMMQWAIGIYTDLAQWAVPIAVAFAMCNLIVDSLLSMAFGGRMHFGRGGQ